MAQSKNPKAKKNSTSPTSQKSTEKPSSKPSKARSRKNPDPRRPGINPPRSKQEPKPNPKKQPKPVKQEPAYNLVQIDLTTGLAEALEFQSVWDLGEHLRSLLNKDFQVFVFEEGRRCHITKGPFRYLRLPDESAVPLFTAPSFQEMEIDESGILSENYDPETRWALEEDEVQSLLGDSATGAWPYTNPDIPLSDNFGDIEDTGFHDEEEEEYLSQDEIDEQALIALQKDRGHHPDEDFDEEGESWADEEESEEDEKAPFE